jgi:hypothetical protein
VIYKLHYIKGGDKRNESVRATYDETTGGKLQVIPYTASVRLLNCLSMKFPAEHRPDYCPTIAERIELLRFVKENRERILAEYPIKTYEGWCESGFGGFDEYYKPGDEIDEATADYLLNVVPPATHRSDLIQCGEPYSHDIDEKGNYRATYATLSASGGKWIYCGVCFRGETANHSENLCAIDRMIKELQIQKERR